jgi:hypothetical protein
VRRWPLLVATSFLTVLSAMAPTGWLFALAYGRFATAYTGGAAFLEFALPFAAMILCALPGIYIGVRLFVTVPLVFVEAHTPVSAQVRSWKLMAGHFWSAALAYQPLGLAVLVLGAPLALVLAGTPFAALAVPGNPGLAGFVVALRLVGPLGWTLYMIYCLQLLETERAGPS